MVRCWYSLLVKSCVQSALSLFRTPVASCPQCPPKVLLRFPTAQKAPSVLQASLDLQVQQASELHFWINLMTCPFSDPHWCTGRGLKYQVEKNNSLQVNHRQTLYNLFGSSYGPDGTPGVGGAGLGLGAWIFSADFERRKPPSSMTQLRSTLMYRRKGPQVSHRLQFNSFTFGDFVGISQTALSLCHSGELRVSGEYQNVSDVCDQLLSLWFPAGQMEPLVQQATPDPVEQALGDGHHESSLLETKFLGQFF